MLHIILALFLLVIFLWLIKIVKSAIKKAEAQKHIDATINQKIWKSDLYHRHAKYINNNCYRSSRC
jgi:cell division protein FtsX